MFLRVQNNGKWGYYDPSNQKTIDSQFIWADSFDGGFAIVRSDNYKCGVINSDGTVVIPFKYQSIEKEKDGFFRVHINDCSSIINTDCTLLDDDYNAFPDELQKYSCVQKALEGLYIVANNDKVGVYKNGVEVIPCSYYHISFLDDDHLIVKGEEYGDSGLIGIDGGTIIPLDYKEIGCFNKNVFYGEKYGWDCYSDCGEFICRINNNYGKVKSIVQVEGDIFRIEYDEHPFDINLKEGKVYLSHDGNDIQISLKYDYYGPFVNGLCEVGKEGRIGFVDIAGEEVIPCEYNRVEFIGDLALLKKDYSKYSSHKEERIVVFSLEQKKVISEKEYLRVSVFKEGYAIVCDSYNRYGVINRLCVETIPTSYKNVSETDDPEVVLAEDYGGSFYYRKDGTLVFKNKAGHFINAPADIKKCYPFSDGLAIVRSIDNSYGFMNDDSKIVIPCKFKNIVACVDSFSDGYAKITRMVNRGGVFEHTGDICKINRKGEFVVQFNNNPIVVKADQLCFVFDFEDNVARAIDSSGNWGLIDPNGNPVTRFEYSFIHPFINAEAIVERDGKMGVLCNDGEITIPIKFTELKRQKECFISKEGLLDNNGHFIAGEHLFDASSYDECVPYEEKLYKLCSLGKYGLADSLGTIVLPCEYEEVGKLENDYCFCKNSCAAVLVSTQGHLIDLPEDTRKAKYYPGGYICLEKATGHRSLVNENGDTFIPDVGQKIIDIRDSLVVVSSKRYTSKEQQGVIDLSGKEIVPPVFDSICFDNIPNTFLAKDGNKEQRYDSKGNIVSVLNGDIFVIDSHYSACKDFQEGFALVARIKPAPYVCKASRHHSHNVDPSDSLDDDFFDILVGDSLNNILIDHQSSDTGDEDGHLDYFEFNENRRNIREALLWGYVNEQGEEVIPCQFVDASCFSDGLAKASYGMYYGYIDKTGSFIIPRRFKQASNFINGFATTQGENYRSQSVIDKNGETIIPYSEYDSLDVVRDGLALAMRIDYQRYTRPQNKYGYIKPGGEIAIPFIFDSASPFENGTATVLLSKLGKSIRINKDGCPIVSYKGDDYAVKLDLERLSYLGDCHDGILCFGYKDEGKGLISINGDVLVDPQFMNISYSQKGEWCVPLTEKTLFFANDYKKLTDGVCTLMPVSPRYQLVDFLVDDKFLVSDWENKGVIDGLGQLIVPCRHKSITLSSDNKYLICSREYNHYSIDDETGPFIESLKQVFKITGEQVLLDGDLEYIVPVDYEACEGFLGNGLAPVMKNGLWGFINRDLEEVIECRFSYFCWREDGYCLVEEKDGYHSYKALICRNGDYLLTPGDYLEISVFQNGYAKISMYDFYQTEKNETRDPDDGETYVEEKPVYEERIIDEKGRLVLNCKHDSVTLPQEYKWFVINPDESVSVFDGENWGLLDKDLNVIVPCLYKEQFFFNGDYAVTRNEDGTGVINCSNDVIVEFEYDRIQDYSNKGLFYSWKGHCASVFDTGGKKLLELDSDEVYPLSKRFTKFKRLKDRKWRWSGALCGFIDHETGRESFGYDDVGEEREELISVKKEGKWGYVDYDGKLVIPYGYLKAWPFFNGKALVSNLKDNANLPANKLSQFKVINDKDRYLWGMINKDGSTAIPFMYRNPLYIRGTNYSEIVASYDGIETYLDLSGSPISVINNENAVTIPGYYASGKSFVNGRTLVYGDDGVGVVDARGKLVIPCRYFGELVRGPVLKSDGTMEVQLFRNQDDAITLSMDETGRLQTSKDGQVISLPLKYIFAKEWTGRFLPVLCGDNWGVLDDSFDEVVPGIYKDVFVLKEKAVAKTGTGYLLIDLSSHATLSLDFDDIKPISDCNLLVSKRVLVETGSRVLPAVEQTRYGLLDLDGSVLLKASFDTITAEAPEPEQDEEESDNDYGYDSYEEPEHYGKYAGTYAQDVRGFSDETIDDVFDGDPDMVWNID